MNTNENQRYKLTPDTHRLPSLVRFTNPIEPAREDSKSRTLGKGDWEQIDRILQIEEIAKG